MGVISTEEFYEETTTFSYTMKLVLLFACLVVIFTQQTQAIDTPEEWMLLHNAVRAEVGVGPLKWNTTLQNYAERYAQQRSGDCQLIHSHGPYGENIYWGQGEGYTDAVDAMRSWVDEEVDYYDHDSNSCLDGKQCLHYTQIVWKETLLFGCGMADCVDVENKVFISCNYYPPGNFYGGRPY